MIIPCKNCITLSVCRAFIVQREENYNKQNLQEDEYNEETIYYLLGKCELLLQYLPCDLIIGNKFIRKSNRTIMDNWLWYNRLDKVFAFFGSKWPGVILDIKND